MGVQVAVGIVSALVSIGLFVLIRRELRTVKEALSDLRRVAMDGHGYSDPSAAAVVTEGREAWPEAEPAVTREALPAAARGGAKGLDERETPQGKTPRSASKGRAVALEMWAPLDADEIARIDELAEQRGMTREELMPVLLAKGLTSLEGRRK